MLRILTLGLAVLSLAGAVPPAGGAAAEPSTSAVRLRAPDVRYEPSPPEVVRAMLKLANVTARDVVYDLGSGDGRIPIAAAREFGARGVGIDIDPKLVARSRLNARKAGVAERVSFRNEDLFQADFSDATVVMLFLYPDVNLKLRPRLLRTLKPGTRVVSHWHDMGDWKPQARVRVSNRPLYLWIVPPRAGS
jgi:SAM-dependent methyltransferase